MMNSWGNLPALHCRRLAMAATCLIPLMMGCPKEGETYRKLGEKDDVTNTTPDDHHHHDAGPHGGHIIELGDYHGEVSLDKDRVLTLYILGGDAATAAPVTDATAKVRAKVGTAQKEIPLKAAPLDGETDGKTSRFTAAADQVPTEIIDVEDLAGDVILVIAGKETVGTIEHDHDHDHGDDHDHPAEKTPAEKK